MLPHINLAGLATAAHDTTRPGAGQADGSSFEKHIDDAGYEADDEHEAEQPSRTSSAELKDAYDHVTGFHLTSAAGKTSIQQGGFDMSKKSGNSAAVALQDNVQAQEECAANHYVSMPSTRPSGAMAQERQAAMRLPLVVMGAHGVTSPSVVRTLVPRGELTPDAMFESSPQRAFMMPNQSADRVLQSHGAPSEGNVRAFAELAGQHLGHAVSLEDARQGLIEHQSDSDEDPARLRRR